MSRITSTVRPIRASSTVLAFAALAAFAGPAAAASAPTVGAQKTWTGATSPVSVPGNHLHRGDRIPKGAVLVSRDVTSTGGTAKREVVLTLPTGKRLTGVAVSESGTTSVHVTGIQRHYVGRRRVTITAQALEHHSGTITIYAYGR